VSTPLLSGCQFCETGVFRRPVVNSGSHSSFSPPFEPIGVPLLEAVGAFGTSLRDHRWPLIDARIMGTAAAKLRTTDDHAAFTA
jgi:hypothetical protein